MVRIKQAERALADGRLDDAFELALLEPVRSHSRGQKLIKRLVRAYLARAREHLDSGAIPQALADCDRADRLGGNLSELAELRSAAGRAERANRRSRRRRADLIHTAREHIDGGRLSAGEALLADADRDDRAGPLLGQARARRAAAEAALAGARAALAREDWGEAIDEAIAAAGARPADGEVAELTAEVTAAAVECIRSALNAGRLDAAEALLDRLAALAGANTEVGQLERIIRQCRRAGECVRTGRPRRAAQILRRLVTILPQAAWPAEQEQQARQAAEALDALDAGPLGLLEAGQAPPPEPAEPVVSPGRPSPATAPARTQPSAPPTGLELPRKFTILVDGVGSFLVLRDARVTVGAVSSPDRPELGLIADPDLPTGTIERIDQDYFFRGGGPVRAGGDVTDKLLDDGDAIALSPRCRLKFHRPNAASGSAVLSLSGARLPQADVRRVILMDREIIIGPGPAAHIRADGLSAPAVLHLRAGRLLCRAGDEVTVNDSPARSAQAIGPGDRVRIGPVSLILKET